MRKIGAAKRLPDTSTADSGVIKVVFRKIADLQLDPETRAPIRQDRCAKSPAALSPLASMFRC